MRLCLGTEHSSMEQKRKKKESYNNVEMPYSYISFLNKFPNDTLQNIPYIYIQWSIMLDCKR